MAVKILIVDDEPDLESLISQKFRKEVRQREYELCFASDGVEALELLESDHDIAFLDPGSVLDHPRDFDGAS